MWKIKCIDLYKWALWNTILVLCVIKYITVQLYIYVAQFPAIIVCNHFNFMNMHQKFISFRSNEVYLPTLKMFKGWPPSSSIIEIMTFLAKVVSRPVSGKLVQFPAIEIWNISSRPLDFQLTKTDWWSVPSLSKNGLVTIHNFFQAKQLLRSGWYLRGTYFIPAANTCEL